MSKLTFASDYQMFFGDYNPNLQKWDEYQTTFSKTDNVRFAPFVLQFPEDNSFDRGMAMVIADLTDCAGALGMKLAQVKVIAPNIIWALVIADCIQIISSVQKNLLAGIERTAIIYKSLWKKIYYHFHLLCDYSGWLYQPELFSSAKISISGQSHNLWRICSQDTGDHFVPAFLCFMPLKPKT